ncbi:MAG: hypothetical protein H7Z37_08395, partial [Pyrinomonadaceae bacterium]|nr:hypothetical protein [Pyrinomonadaceae bacterium]
MSEPENNPPKIKVSTFGDEQPQYERVTDEEMPETESASESVGALPKNPIFLDENHADIRQVEPLGDAAKTVEVQIKIVDAGTHQLANAMVGKPYKAVIDLDALKINEEILLESFAKKLSRIGLQVENDLQTKTLRISGTPLSATQGEQEINLDYGDDAAFIHRKTFILLINPDPKSLWKNIEPDADAPYQKSNTATE